MTHCNRLYIKGLNYSYYTEVPVVLERGESGWQWLQRGLGVPAVTPLIAA